MLRVGFIGIGNMGKGMATNLARKLKHSHKQSELFVYDATASSVTSFLKSMSNLNLSSDESISIQSAQSVSDLAKQVDVVLLSLPSESICEDVLFSDDGIANTWRQSASDNKSRIVIDHGTFSNSFSVSNQNKLKELVPDVEYMDAPVSGGPTGANNGTLTIMCGGKEEQYVKYSPLLSTMGSNVMYFGETGSGSAAKLVNQCLVTSHAQAAVEAIHMAESLNLIDLGTRGDNNGDDITKEKKLIQMLSSSWGQSKVLELILQDYISIKRKLNDDKSQASMVSAADIPSAMSPPSAAPLRNLNKDMSCAMSDLGSVIASRKEITDDVSNTNEASERIDAIRDKEFPIFSKSAEQVALACQEGEGNIPGPLSNGPFLSLIELLRPK